MFEAFLRRVMDDSSAGQQLVKPAAEKAVV
jgi:hypothetical protein